MKNWIITAVIIGLLIVGVFAFTSSPNTPSNNVGDSSSPVSELKWFNDLNSAISEAQKTNKPIFAVFSATWCPACQQLDSETLVDERVKQKLAQGYVAVKIDTDSDPQASYQYGIYTLPTIIIMDSSGTEKSRYEGYLSPDQLLNMI